MRHITQKLFPDRPELVSGSDSDVVGNDVASALKPIARAEEILRTIGQPGFASVESIIRDFVASVYPAGS